MLFHKGTSTAAGSESTRRSSEVSGEWHLGTAYATMMELWVHLVVATKATYNFLYVRGSQCAP